MDSKSVGGAGQKVTKWMWGKKSVCKIISPKTRGTIDFVQATLLKDRPDAIVE
jgi:hypothetical protein